MDVLQARESDDSDEEIKKKHKSKNEVMMHIKRKKMREKKRMRAKYDRMLKKIKITTVWVLSDGLG